MNDIGGCFFECQTPEISTSLVVVVYYQDWDQLMHQTAGVHEGANCKNSYSSLCGTFINQALQKCMLLKLLKIV